MLRENSIRGNVANMFEIIPETNHCTYPCVMNSKLIFSKDESYVSYTCTACPGKPDNICHLCMENCHKNHVTNRKNMKERRVNIKTSQCSCALRDHKALKQRAILNELVQDADEIQCSLSEVIYESSIKHFYFDPVSNDYYCLYCLDACQGVLHDALENFVKKEKSTFLQPPKCICANKDAHSHFHENILSLADFILSPFYDKVINRVQLPGQIYSSSSLCEKYLYPIKIAHSTIMKDYKEKNFVKYKTETFSKSYFNSLKLLQSLAQVLKKDNNLITNKNIQNFCSFDFLVEIFSANFYEDYSIIDTKISTLYFFRKFFLLPTINYKKWHDGYSDIDNITPFHRLLGRKSINDFFKLSKLNKKVFIKLLDNIQLCLVKYYDKTEETQYTQLVIEYLKWITLIISYKFESLNKESKMIYNHIIYKFLQTVDLVSLRKSYESSLKKHIEIFIIKIMLQTNDNILFDKIFPNKSRFVGSDYEQFCEEICCYPLKSNHNLLNINEEYNKNGYKLERKSKNNIYPLNEEEGDRSIINISEEIILPDEADEPQQIAGDFYYTDFKGSEQKFLFETGEFQLNLLKTLFAFGKDERDLSMHISSVEIYDMLVNDNDYYYHGIDDFINCKNSKDNLEVLIQSSKGRIELTPDEEKYISLIKGSIEFLSNSKKKFYAGAINVKELIDCTINIFHVTLKYLAGLVLTEYICGEDENSQSKLEKIRENNFKIQIYLYRSGLFDTLLDMFYLLTSNKFIANSVDEIDPIGLNIGLNEILKNFLILSHENSFLSAILFSKHILSILFEYKYEEERDYIIKSFFVDILKIVSRTKHKLNFLNFLDIIFKSNFDLDKLNSICYQNKKRQSYFFEEKKIIAHLSILKKVLKNSTSKTLTKINSSIGFFIKKILSSNFYKIKLEYFKNNIDESDEFSKKFLCEVHKIINKLEDSYFSIITDYLNITAIEFLLSQDNLDPISRRIFTITYSKFYSECSFKIFESLNKKGMKNFRNKIDYNLISKFVILDGESETEKNEFKTLQNFESLRQTEDNLTSENQTSNFTPDAVFLPLLQNMEKYKRIINNFSEDYFQRKIRFFVKYFIDVILFPTIFSIYKILYFSARTSAKNKYLIYRFIYLFILCYKHFLLCITKGKDLNLMGSLKRSMTDNLIYISNCFNQERKSCLSEINSTIDFMLTTVEELDKDINLFQADEFDLLKLEIIMEKFSKYLKQFKAANNVLSVYAEEREDVTSQDKDKKETKIKKSSLTVSVRDKVKSFLTDYRERKNNLEKNILFLLYQEQASDCTGRDFLKKTIALDLLYRLRGPDKSEDKILTEDLNSRSRNTNLVSNRDLPLVSYASNLETNCINTDMKRSDSLDYVNQYTTALQETELIDENQFEENHLTGVYSEDNSEILATINKLFKANPGLWQEIITDSCPVLKKKIFYIIRKELTHVIQFIFIKFHKLSRCLDDDEIRRVSIFTFEKTYMLQIIEFFRLFCENHHKIFQTFLTHNYIKHQELNLIDFMLQIPVAVLIHSDYFKEKKTRGILKYFRADKSEDRDYFDDLLDSINSFLIELIQGAFADNFDFLASRKEFKNFYEYGYRFFDSIDTGEDGERFSANFMKFINCYLEENTNSVENKAAIVKKFKPSKLLNVLLFSFKKLCCVYLAENKKYFSRENKIDQHAVNSYNINTSASKDLLEIFKQKDSIKNHHLFILASNIFIFFKASSYFKCGEKIKTLMTNLQKLSTINPDKIPEKSKHTTIAKIEVYNFFSTIIKEVEVSYKFNNQMDDFELIKYRDYFDEDFFKFDKLKKYTKVEINGIQNVIYVVHPDSLLIETGDLVKFNETAPFENFNIKLTYVLEYYHTLYSLIQSRKSLSNKNSKFLNFLFYLDYHKACLVSILLTIILNTLIVLTSLVTDKKHALYRDSIDPSELYGVLPYRGKYSNLHEENHSGHISKMIEAYGNTALNCISIFHFIFLLFLILNWMNFSVYKLNNLDSNSKNKSLLHKFKLYTALLFEKDIFPLVWIFMFLFLALSNNDYKFAYSIQLLAIFQKVPTMQTVIYSVTIRYKQFVSATFLIIILMLFYSSISFYLFRDEYYNPDINENVCGTFLSCFLSLITNGIRGGAGLGFSSKSFKDRNYFNAFIFEWVFYFSIMLIMLNVINGIIVDTFQALREQNNLKEDIKENVCYICSLNRSKFDIRGVSYDHHVNVEHNILNYFYYILKVQLSDEQELNSLDYQVLNYIKGLRTDFFPIKKALSLA